MIGAFLEATVGDALTRRGAGSQLAIAIQSPTPPDRDRIRDLRVVWCRSTLEIREHLSAPDPAGLVIVTPLEEELAADIRARLYKQKLLRIKVEELLKQVYEAREVDRRISDDSALSGALLRCAPMPVAGGILHEEAAWQTVCAQVFDLPTARPDALSLLRWIAGPAAERLASVPADLRERLQQWLIRASGPLAEILLAVVHAGHARSALAIGLALRTILADQKQPELAQALVRLERFTGNRPIAPDVAAAWAAAAEQLVVAGDTVGIVSSADRLLHELGAAQFANLSRWSLIGNEQLVDVFASELAELPSNPARLESGLANLRDRFWPKDQESVLGRLEMATRLLRWLHRSGPTFTDFEDFAGWYAAEGSWVDWARTRVRSGYERGPLAEAFGRLTAAVKEHRERWNLQFAGTLAAWNNHGAHFRALCGVESVLPKYIPPEQPVLVLVLDGMSIAVCRELCADLGRRRWSAWSPDGNEIPPAVTALPSVTELSRFSLLSGNLSRGTQGAEEAAFGARPLATRQHPPVLFHKNDLAAIAADSPVLREIADTRRLVVGVVVNAIDDSLSGPVQIAPDWTLDYLPVLRPLLEEASAAGRIVLLTSDHGHVLDYGSEFRRQDGSDRYRPGKAQTPGEFTIEGGRVVGAAAVTVLGVEGVRYSAKPRNGYHGGITPQECLAPVVVLADREEAIRGWKEVTEAAPEWWLAATVSPAPVEAPKPKRKSKAQPSLFVEETDWVAALLANEVFRQQLNLPGNRIGAETIATALRALDVAGGRLLRRVFASRMNLALVRVNTTVAMMQRVLNYDGYEVLTIDEAADMIVLNRSLLEVQFRQ